MLIRFRCAVNSLHIFSAIPTITTITLYTINNVTDIKYPNIGYNSRVLIVRLSWVSFDARLS